MLFDSKPVYNETHLKTKIKSYEEKVNKNVHDDKMPKEGSHYIFLLSALINGTPDYKV